MLSKSQAIEGSRKVYHQNTDEELRSLPYKEALIYGRVSDPNQIRSSRESIKEIAKLVELAIGDGYQTDLNPSDVEDWLDKVSNGLSAKGVIASGQVTVDIRDLGLSGQLSAEDRKGLADLHEDVLNDKKGAVYLTEGVTRLSRDQDRIAPYQLLKMLKEHKVRIGTPDGVWDPAIERDWEELASDFEKASGRRKS